MTGETNNAKGLRARLGKTGFRFLGVIILGAGIGIAAWFVMSRPEAKSRQRRKVIPIVEVAKIAPVDVPVRVQAMGTVLAADEALIQAQVTGQIMWVHPQMAEGGFVDYDTVLVKIDERDYRLELDRRRASRRSASAELSIERGAQDIAAMEWELVNERDWGAGLDRELALRKPHLRAAKASVASARAGVKKAELDLDRTKVRAPFNAVIAEAKADVGDLASPGIVLARLIATDTFRVKASVRTDQLKWLDFPGADEKKGSSVAIYPSSGKKRDGRLFKLMPELETTGRMARVLIEVSDPLLLESEKGERRALLLGEFVRVEILGTTVKNVIAIQRTALREGSNIWLLDREKRLRITPVNILWGNFDTVYVKNEFEPGASLITSSLGTPVEGMALSIEGDSDTGAKYPITTGHGH